MIQFFMTLDSQRKTSSRVYVDFAGPFYKKDVSTNNWSYDAHYKWKDIHCVNSATSSTTIDKLKTTFASTMSTRDFCVRQ